MTLSIADIVIIVFYFLVIFSVGFILASRKRDKSGDNGEDFILAGRSVTLPMFVGTLVATWYGNILGAGEFVYGSGIVAWVCFGLPYYFAAIIFALFFAAKVRNMNVKTIPEQIENEYGYLAGKISSVIVLIITLPATYVLILGVIIEMFTGMGLSLSIVIGAALSLAYIYTGGFRADVFTNMAQFVVMYLGFAVLLFFAINQLGSVSDMAGNLPEGHLDIFGGFSWQVILSWYIIAFQTFVDPGFHQRCSAAKTPGTARNGVLISVLFWAVFDFMTMITGLYAKAYISVENPMFAYPALADSILPFVWKGVFLVALLATVMSTLDSYAFISAATIGNDILKPIFGKKDKDKHTTRYFTRAGLVITGVFSVALAIILPSAIELIYLTSSIAVPGLIFPMLASFSRKLHIDGKNSVIIMISGSGISAIWTLLNKTEGFHSSIFKGIEPMLPGIFVSLILSIIFTKTINNISLKEKQKIE